VGVSPHERAPGGHLVSALGVRRTTGTQPAPNEVLVAAVVLGFVQEPERPAPSKEPPQPLPSRRLAEAGAPLSPAGLGWVMVGVRL